MLVDNVVIETWVCLDILKLTHIFYAASSITYRTFKFAILNEVCL